MTTDLDAPVTGPATPPINLEVPPVDEGKLAQFEANLAQATTETPPVTAEAVPGANVDLDAPVAPATQFAAPPDSLTNLAAWPENPSTTPSGKPILKLHLMDQLTSQPEDKDTDEVEVIITTKRGLVGLIDRLSDLTRTDHSDIIRKGTALVDVALKAKQQGYKMVLLDRNGEVAKTIDNVEN